MNKAEPGFWRRIRLNPMPSLIRAGLEDDFHCFLIEITHANGVITGLETSSKRIPWSTCSEAGSFLASEVIGKELSIVAGLDPHMHCTHLFELLILCAAHANDTQPIQFDLRVPDRKLSKTRASLQKNGHEELYWQLDGTLIDGPYAWTGRDLRQLSQWRSLLSAVDREHAMLLRRAVHISGGRNSQNINIERASDRGPSRMGACFTYQMPRALDALRSPNWVRDFSQSGVEPLHDFYPEDFNSGEPS